MINPQMFFKMRKSDFKRLLMLIDKVIDSVNNVNFIAGKDANVEIECAKIRDRMTVIHSILINNAGNPNEDSNKNSK